MNGSLAKYFAGRLGRPSSGTRASTEKKKGQNKQAAAAAAAQALQDRFSYKSAGQAMKHNLQYCPVMASTLPTHDNCLGCHELAQLTPRLDKTAAFASLPVRVKSHDSMEHHNCLSSDEQCLAACPHPFSASPAACMIYTVSVHIVSCLVFSGSFPCFLLLVFFTTFLSPLSPHPPAPLPAFLRPPSATPLPPLFLSCDLDNVCCTSPFLSCAGKACEALCLRVTKQTSGPCVQLQLSMFQLEAAVLHQRLRVGIMEHLLSTSNPMTQKLMQSCFSKI